MITTTTAVACSAIALTGAAMAVAATLPAGHEHHTEPAPGLVPTGFRYCPAEQRTRAAVLHADGTATCADPGCGTHIPAGDS